MSQTYFTAAWNSNLPRPQACVLQAIADFVDDDGVGCWASFERLAYKSRYERRQVIRIVAQLIEAGIVYSEEYHTKFGTNVMGINLDRIPPLPPYEEWSREQKRIEEEHAGQNVTPRKGKPSGQNVTPFQGALTGQNVIQEDADLDKMSYDSEESESESISMSNTVIENLLPQIPEAQKEEEELLSPESRTFWDMFTKRHQAVFNHPYNGPAVEIDTHPILRTLQALDASERFDIVNKGIKAMADSGQIGTVGSWSLYETEIQRAIDDYVAQRKANQVIGMFTMNLNEALVRCGMPVMTGTYTQSQRQAIAAWGHMLDANDLEKTILLYGPTHPKDHQPFMINVKLNWVIETAKNNRLAAASGAVPAAKNGNGKGYNANNSYSGYGSARSSNNGNGRGQSGGQLSLDDFKQIARDLGQLPDV